MVALIGVVVSSVAVVISRKPEQTGINLIIAASLFLPVGVSLKFPGSPVLDRETLPYLCVLIAYAIRRGRWSRPRVGRGPEALLLLSMIAGVLTAVTNSDPLRLAKLAPASLKIGEALTYKDALAYARSDLVEIGIPFLLGRVLMRGPAEGLHLVKALAVGGLIYTVPILIELRLSPQMHAWVYGQAARPLDFAQALRGDGYRPTVFLPHGLAVSLYMCIALLAAVSLWRARRKVLRLSWSWPSLYLAAILVACKSLAAIIYAATLAPLTGWMRARRQSRIAMLLAIAFLVYPLMRAYDLVPTDKFLEAAEYIGGEERAGSLASRFQSEDLLLERARERALFGWGGFGRAGVYNDWGTSLAIFDGFWITRIAHRGTVHLVVISVLLVWPIFRLVRRWKRLAPNDDRYLVAGLAVMIGATAIDLLPNGLFLNYPYFLSGALYGLTWALEAAARTPVAAPAPTASARGENAPVASDWHVPTEPLR